MKYYKFLSKSLTHNGFTYKPNSINTDPLPFNPTGSCEKGGLYFAREDCLQFINYYVCEVEPIGEVYKDHVYIEKWKAHSLKLGPLMKTEDVLEKLIAEGAKLTSANLDLIIHHNYIEILKLLLKAGVKPTNHNLDIAVYYNRKEVVELLLKAGAKPSSYALSQAIINNYTEIVELLNENS